MKFISRRRPIFPLVCPLADVPEVGLPSSPLVLPKLYRSFVETIIPVVRISLVTGAPAGDNLLLSSPRPIPFSKVLIPLRLRLFISWTSSSSVSDLTTPWVICIDSTEVGDKADAGDNIPDPALDTWPVSELGIEIEGPPFLGFFFAGADPSEGRFLHERCLVPGRLSGPRRFGTASY